MSIKIGTLIGVNASNRGMNCPHRSNRGLSTPSTPDIAYSRQLASQGVVSPRR